MSALGQKQTYAMQKGMSALPPKADMCSAARDVRFGPIAVAPTRSRRQPLSCTTARGTSICFGGHGIEP